MNPLLMALAMAATPSPPFAPMQFLVDRCWTATLPDGRARDTHCFAWLYPGHFLRDTHVVCVDGRPAYSGETTYGLEPGTGTLRWRYLSVLGMTMDGHVAAQGDALHFTGRYLSGESLRDIRATWRRTKDGYRVLSEERSGDEPWTTTQDLEFTADARTAPDCG